MPSTNTPELVAQKQEVEGFSPRATEVTSTPFFPSKRDMCVWFYARSLFACWISADISGVSSFEQEISDCDLLSII